MMKKFKKAEPNDLQKEITRLFAELKTLHPDSEEYNKVADQAAKLYKLQEIDSKQKVSKDQMVAALTSLAGIVIVVSYEHAHVIAAKAFSLVKK